jgi:hypothetical protein
MMIVIVKSMAVTATNYPTKATAASGTTPNRYISAMRLCCNLHIDDCNTYNICNTHYYLM